MLKSTITYPSVSFSSGGLHIPARARSSTMHFAANRGDTCGEQLFSRGFLRRPLSYYGLSPHCNVALCIPRVVQKKWVLFNASLMDVILSNINCICERSNVLQGYLPLIAERREAMLERKRQEYHNFIVQYYSTRLQDIHQDTYRQVRLIYYCNH